MKKVTAKKTAVKAVAEKPAPKSKSKASKPASTPKKTVTAAVKTAATKKKTTAQPVAARTRKPRVKEAFNKALGAWAKNELAARASDKPEVKDKRGGLHEEIESKKFEIHPDTEPIATEYDRVPLSFPLTRVLDDMYNETRLVVLVRDPEWVFAYWDIDAETRKRLGIPQGKHNRRMLIRWYDVTDLPRFDGHNAHRVMDIEISDAARSWYQKMPESSRCWLADLGIIDDHGHFVAICRSNLVRTPRMTLASESEETLWMYVEQGRQPEIVAKGPRGRLLKRGERGVPKGDKPLVAELDEDEVPRFLGATESYVRPPRKKREEKKVEVKEVVPMGASGFIGGSEGRMGASEHLVNRKK